MMAPNPRLIGTTDIAAILGCHPWLTAYQLWQRITQGIEQPREIQSLRRMETGLLRQEQIASWWASDIGVATCACGAPDERRLEVGPYVEAPHGRVWQRVSTDYVVRAPGQPDEGVEVKLTERLGDEWGPGGTDIVPQHYMVQVQAQCEALGWPRAHVVVGWGLSAYRAYAVDAVPELGAHLVDLAASWWAAHVDTDIPPALTAAEMYRARWDAVRARFGRAAGLEREATAVEVELATEIARLRRMAKQLETTSREAELRLRESMGEDVGRIWWDHPKDGSRVICRPNKAGATVDWKAIAEALEAPQALIAQHTRAKKPVRPLRVTLKGQEDDES